MLLAPAFFPEVLFLSAIFKLLLQLQKVGFISEVKHFFYLKSLLNFFYVSIWKLAFQTFLSFVEEKHITGC